MSGSRVRAGADDAKSIKEAGDDKRTFGAIPRHLRGN